jgi:hypothetical protein
MTVNHPHGIHCMHIHGWNVYLWCNPCYLAWQETSGRIGDRKTEIEADRTLARQVVAGMIDGRLDTPREVLDLMAAPETKVSDPWWRDSEF